MSDEIKQALDTLKKATANCAIGDRHITVLDRGWIMVGNMSLDKDTGVYTMTDCANIRSFKKVGFGGLTQGAKNAEAVLDKCAPIKFHARAMIFCVPISEGWENA
jgi:hypothetical protein